MILPNTSLSSLPNGSIGGHTGNSKTPHGSSSNKEQSLDFPVEWYEREEPDVFTYDADCSYFEVFFNDVDKLVSSPCLILGFCEMGSLKSKVGYIGLRYLME